MCVSEEEMGWCSYVPMCMMWLFAVAQEEMRLLVSWLVGHPCSMRLLTLYFFVRHVIGSGHLRGIYFQFGHVCFVLLDAKILVSQALAKVRFGAAKPRRRIPASFEWSKRKSRRYCRYRYISPYLTFAANTLVIDRLIIFVFVAVQTHRSPFRGTLPMNLG